MWTKILLTSTRHGIRWVRVQTFLHEINRSITNEIWKSMNKTIVSYFFVRWCDERWNNYIWKEIDWNEPFTDDGERIEDIFSLVRTFTNDKWRMKFSNSVNLLSYCMQRSRYYWHRRSIPVLVLTFHIWPWLTMNRSKTKRTGRLVLGIRRVSTSIVQKSCSIRKSVGVVNCSHSWSMNME
jgi:hypothetical protein